MLGGHHHHGHSHGDDESHSHDHKVNGIEGLGVLSFFNKYHRNPTSISEQRHSTSLAIYSHPSVRRMAEKKKEKYVTNGVKIRRTHFIYCINFQARLHSCRSHVHICFLDYCALHHVPFGEGFDCRVDGRRTWSYSTRGD